jgi:hypothetical protein
MGKASKPSPEMVRAQALEASRHALLDAIGARKLGEPYAQTYSVRGAALVVVEYTAVDGEPSGWDAFVPLCSSLRASTTQAAAVSWARMDTRCGSVRVPHPDLPDEHAVTAVGVTRGAHVDLTVHYGGAQRRDSYSPNEARALAWELLHAADMADDAAAEAAEKDGTP